MGRRLATASAVLVGHCEQGCPAGLQHPIALPDVLVTPDMFHHLRRGNIVEAVGWEREVLRVSNQEAGITICCDSEEASVLNEFGLEQFAALCIVSEVKLQKAVGETTVGAQKSSYNKCQRCWNFWPSVGANSEHPDLCERCISVVRKN